jgi:metal-sulfur cluster biosynthetic enzyme
MATVSERDVLSKLARLHDPDLGRDIVSLGFHQDNKTIGKSSLRGKWKRPKCGVSAEYPRG